MVLIFFGTLDQVNLGIQAAQAKYFRSLWVWHAFGGSGMKLPILPGGYLIGALLLINLVAAHFARFQPSWKKSGIVLIHTGVVVLLLSELFTAALARESMMPMNEGETKTYSEAQYSTELAVIDTTDPATDKVVAIPEKILASTAVIQHPALPFTIEVVAFMANANLFMRAQMTNPPPAVADQGLGVRIHAEEIPRTVKMNERDLTTVLIRIEDGDQSSGTWLVSNALGKAQTFTHAGRSYSLRLRAARDYKPFSLTLLDFQHDVYPGTMIPKNFSSRVRLIDPGQNEDREVLIYMNNPLRYAGYTFFQSGFDNNDTTSILQVVKNPAYILPYISCVLVAAGLIVQFGMHLLKFLKRRSTI